MKTIDPNKLEKVTGGFAPIPPVLPDSTSEPQPPRNPIPKELRGARF